MLIDKELCHPFGKALFKVSQVEFFLCLVLSVLSVLSVVLGVHTVHERVGRMLGLENDIFFGQRL